MVIVRELDCLSMRLKFRRTPYCDRLSTNWHYQGAELQMEEALDAYAALAV